MKKNIITTLSALFLASILVLTSCKNDLLDLGPIDYYGSQSYWKNESHVKSYVVGLHKNMRDVSWTHMIVFGELRGGGVSDADATIDGSAINYGNILKQNFDEVNTGVSNYADYYGKITNCNLFIKKVNEASFLNDEQKAYYLGIGHGLRAFYFFDLYRVFGSVPLRLGTEVIDGVLDVVALRKKPSPADSVVLQIKDDLQKSYDYFGNNTQFDKLNLGGDKNYWSKAATECLMGEVYLWTSKVSTGNFTANPNDLAIAKKHLESVKDNYGLSLLPNFTDVFNAKTGKNNKEQVFSIAFAENEASNALGTFCYNTSTGMMMNSSYQKDGVTKFGDPVGFVSGGTVMRNEHKKGLYLMFDDEDTRREATFAAAYTSLAEGANLAGLITRKNLGYRNAAGVWQFVGDFTYYRLPWVYLSLAEIANMEGANADVEKYINLVRERAYGNKWSDAFKYVAGDFTKNELAILAEKDKEFVQEGQRWWDMRRMTLTKGGKHLVFAPEGNIDSDTPLLSESTEAYKVLWPINKSQLDNDDQLEQTPGYSK